LVISETVYRDGLLVFPADRPAPISPYSPEFFTAAEKNLHGWRGRSRYSLLRMNPDVNG
jgi:hypothetical protein